MNMNQQEYEAAIKKQQSLMRKLFANRKRRSEVIQEVVDERWKHLVGKFVCLNDKTEEYYCIHGFKAESNFANSDDVRIDMYGTILSPSVQGTGSDAKIVGATVYTERIASYTPDDDIEKLLADKFVIAERVAEQFNRVIRDIARNYGLK